MEMLAEINVEDPNVMSVCHQGQFNDFHQPVDNKNNLSGPESAFTTNDVGKTTDSGIPSSH